MKMWIRSQDKCRLVPKPNLYAVFDKDNNIAYIGDKMVGHIGKYKSLERALEVLDEIEERISLLNTICLVHDNNSLISFKKAIGEDKITGLCFPYQMPKE